ncbi:hypothetical protein L6164_017672 [Bauhinia variegata]|uniref:Uncharacterized protein n=1 Tax=Bauhinia variegata TaxID=167791 RepID=A0ACB9NC47_BAUVA|nr:hypothetical protein L6164_017672 [Bauhinia variegata]
MNDLAGGCDHLKVGAFFEIDHSKLSPKSPEQLNFIRVVMVSEKTKLQVSVRYPSIHSLRTHFTEGNIEKQDGKKIPALDEKYVMGSEFATQVLCRRVPMEEFSEERNSWNFWVTCTEENERDKSPALPDESTILGCKKGSCWSQLKYTGMVQWGKRRQVRFLGRHEEQKFESLAVSLERKETGVDKTEQKGRERGSTKKRKKDEDTEAVQAMSLEVRRTRQSERNQNERRGIQKSKESKAKKQSQVICSKKRKLSIDRWSAERYKLAEESMLKVMKAKGAVYGNPILRPALRTEARKLIGDTGLLDHLLKHMAGKVAPGETYRFRRRHNAEGSMEYWLESADLVNIRREAGVEDPYWTPPVGWKPGDNPSQDPICAKEIREMKEEIAKLKIDVQELLSKKQEDALAIVATPSSCLSSLNLDNECSLISMQEMYVELVNKKAKIDEKLEEISKTLSGMEEQLGTLKSGVEEPIMSESVTPPALLSAPTTVEAGPGGETKEEEDRNKGRKSGEEQSDDDEDIRRPESRTAEDKATKIQRLRTGFQIFKSQGSFIWPNFSLSPDQNVVPTPPSASSSTIPATQLVPSPHPPNVPKPSSPVKPRAEKRPVSTAILTHVTNPFTPALLSPSMQTPKDKVTATQKATLINLNEAPPPPQIYDTSFCGTPKFPRVWV